MTHDPNVPAALAFVQLTAGNVHTCGLTATGTAYCWGRAGNGRLGNGTTTGDQASLTHEHIRADPPLR